MTHLFRAGRRRAALWPGGWVMGVALLLALAGLGLYFRYQQAGRQPPALASTIEDPEVARTIDAARSAVRQSPRSSQAWGRLGMLWAAHDYFAEAQDCFAEAERLDSREPRWPYHRGLILRPSDPVAALPFLERAVVLWGGTVDAPELVLAEMLLELGRLDEAERHFNQVLRRSPRDERCQFGLGRLACERNDLSGALAYLLPAANSPHARKAVHALRAGVYRRLGDAAAADRELALVASLPDDALWPDPVLQEVTSLKVGQLAQLSEVSRLARQNQLEDAVFILKQMVQNNPRSERAWVWLGRIHLQIGKLAYAEQFLEAAVQCAPDSADAYFLLGLAQFQQGKVDAAANNFGRVVQLKPNDGATHYELGLCLRQRGERAEAIAAFGRAVRARPYLVAAHHQLVELHAERGHLHQAFEHLGHALSLSPAHPQTCLLLARLVGPVTFPLSWLGW